MKNLDNVLDNDMQFSKDKCQSFCEETVLCIRTLCLLYTAKFVFLILLLLFLNLFVIVSVELSYCAKIFISNQKRNKIP